MKISVEAKVELDVEMKDVLAFLVEEKLEPEQYDKIILEALRRKKGFFTIEDQRKFEIFEEYKEQHTSTELEYLLKV